MSKNRKDNELERKYALRIGATIPIWGILFALNFLLSFGVEDNFLVPIVFASLAAGVLVTGFVWDWGRGDRVSDADRLQSYLADNADNEKRKRDRLSQALSDLSDSQLKALRDGIRDGTLDDERLRYLIDDEGELVQRL